jgi:glycosyltransferase involved in cell wall biosynthesis
VVPSYNYARYLPGRLSSIFAQRHPASEVIVLDDASSDGSAEAASRIAAQWRQTIRLVGNATNSGSVFGQWRKAAELARGTFLWIAEADDEADPGFLAALAARLAETPDIDLAFTDSRAIDAEGRETRPDHQEYYRQADATALGRDGLFPARQFARRFLGQRNLILNASAVLWRRTALLAALDRCGDELAQYRMAGDWRVYVELMAESEGQVAYVAAPLNAHRLHAQSVSATLANSRHIAEIALVHAAVRSRLGLPGSGQAAYRRLVSRQLRTIGAG